MTAQLNENTQYTDPTTGELLSNGLVYVGQNGLDAELNPIIIYADKDLAIPLLNPQRTGSDGRVANKIYIPGKYSLKVKNSDNVQKLNDLSLGEVSAIGNTALTNIQGSDSLVADASPAIDTLIDNQTYIFTTVLANTGAMTLTIDTAPTYPIKKYHDIDMELGDIEARQIMAVTWNATDSVFELVTNIVSLTETVKSYANIAALRAITAVPSITDATTRGYYTDGDGGANPNGYYWHITSTDTDDGISTFEAPAITIGRWKAKFSGVINIKWGGAGTSDDTTIFTNAIAIGPILIPEGTFIVDSPSLVTGAFITGLGSKSIVKLKDASNGYCFFGNGVSDVTIRNLKLDGNSANNVTSGSGVRILGVSDDLRVEDSEITDFRTNGISVASTGTRATIKGNNIHNNLADGIGAIDMTKIKVEGNHVHNNGDSGIEIASDANQAVIGDNLVHDNGGVGIIVAQGSGALDDISITGNLSFNNGSHGIQGNNVTRYQVTGNISHSNGISGIDSFGCDYAAISGNVSYNNTYRGIEIDSEAYYNTVTGNTVYRNAKEGISVFRSPSAIIMGNQVIENSTEGSGLYHGIRLWATSTPASANCRIIGNNSSDDRGGSATQGYGISLENSPTNTVIIGNKLTPNVTGAISGASGNILEVSGNQGFTTLNTGSSSIVSGTTSIVISHGLDITPSARDFNLMLTSGPTNDIGTFHISSITSTQATINCRADPGASGANFSWKTRVF